MRLLLTTAFWTFVLDQATKWLVVQYLNLKTIGELDVIDPLLVFRMVWNKGVNFGLFASAADYMPYILAVLSVAISLWVVRWAHTDNFGRNAQISAGLLIGGALGNAIDRLVYGAVADFINMSCCGFSNPYAFNVADITIFVGAIGLVLFSGNNKQA